MKKKVELPPRFCWDCAYSRPNEDIRYRTPDDKPIFYNCYRIQTEVRRGLMDNTKACSQFMARCLYSINN